MIGPDFLNGMDDEDDLTGLAVAGGGAPQDILSQLMVLQGDLAKSQERSRNLRQQQLQQATELLKKRRMGPSLAEQLFALSGAFAQPTRSKGLGGVLANVMPTLGQTFAARRQGTQAKEDALLELQQKYALGEIDDEQEAIKSKIALARVGAQASKPQKLDTGFNPVTGRLYNQQTGEEIPLGGSAAGAVPETKTVGGVTYYKVGGEWFVLDGSGGQTGSRPSGGFRP